MVLNREYILEAIRPYLTKDKKLRESDFNRLFSDLTRKEQYQIIEILIDADIDYVDDEASPPIDQKSIIDIFTEIESESIFLDREGLFQHCKQRFPSGDIFGKAGFTKFSYTRPIFLKQCLICCI